MPRDATDMPNARSAPFRTEDRLPEREGQASAAPLDTTLKIENMLLEEFNYAGTTAYQAMEDRARTFNLYILLIGVLGSGLGALYQLGGSLHSYTQLLAIALLVIAGFLGSVFFVQLLRLRQAHRESLIAMNTVKEYYIEQFLPNMPGIEAAFRWRMQTMPTGERLGSVTFLVCSTVAFLGSLCFAGAAFVVVTGYGLRVGHVLPLPTIIEPYTIPAVVLAVSVLLHVVYYRRTLSKRKEKQVLVTASRTVREGAAKD